MVLCPSGKDPPAKSGELAQEESPPNEQLPAAPAALCEGTGTEKGEWTARMGMSAAVVLDTCPADQDRLLRFCEPGHGDRSPGSSRLRLPVPSRSSSLPPAAFRVAVPGRPSSLHRELGNASGFSHHSDIVSFSVFSFRVPARPSASFRRASSRPAPQRGPPACASPTTSASPVTRHVAEMIRKGCRGRSSIFSEDAHKTTGRGGRGPLHDGRAVAQFLPSLGPRLVSMWLFSMRL